LVGRVSEIQDLNNWFNNSRTKLTLIVAAGGIGKSALTDEWIKLNKENFKNYDLIFGWSFYSQGSHTTYTNSQAFYTSIFDHLGVTEIPSDEIEKGRLLARCLQERKCLLILDGLEPLQYPESMPSMNGELRDAAIKELVICMRHNSPQSYLLVSSRQRIVELDKWGNLDYEVLELDSLTPFDGALILDQLKVIGSKREKEALSKDLGGHALSIVLLGNILREYHQGNIAFAQGVKNLSAPDIKSGSTTAYRHAKRVLDFYDNLQDPHSRDFLQLLGLFDRPMLADEKLVLFSKADQASALNSLNSREWKSLLSHLF